MEWAYELVNGYRRGDARARGLVTRTRTIVVPIVNPDGFNACREAGELYGNGGGARHRPGRRRRRERREFIAAASTHSTSTGARTAACPVGPAAGNCLASPTGRGRRRASTRTATTAPSGAAAGASGNFLDAGLPRPGPFSEPETQNIRELISARQVTTLITNHTFSGLVLRPPGIAAQGTTVDEPIYKALGDSMAAENGYASQYGYQLYDTDRDDRGLVVQRHRRARLHVRDRPPGLPPAVRGDRGRVERHVRLRHRRRQPRRLLQGAGEHGRRRRSTRCSPGRRRPARCCALKKTFQTADLQRGRRFTDTLDTTHGRAREGRFDWHVNPSTRPLVAKAGGRRGHGRPEPAADVLRRAAATCRAPNFDTPPASCYEDHLVTVPSGTGIDNGKAHVPDRVAHAGQRLRPEGLPRRRGRERHRRAGRAALHRATTELRGDAPARAGGARTWCG